MSAQSIDYAAVRRGSCMVRVCCVGLLKYLNLYIVVVIECYSDQRVELGMFVCSSSPDWPSCVAVLLNRNYSGLHRSPRHHSKASSCLRMKSSSSLTVTSKLA